MQTEEAEDSVDGKDRQLVGPVISFGHRVCYRICFWVVLEGKEKRWGNGA